MTKRIHKQKSPEFIYEGHKKSVETKGLPCILVQPDKLFVRQSGRKKTKGPKKPEEVVKAYKKMALKTKYRMLISRVMTINNWCH